MHAVRCSGARAGGRNPVRLALLICLLVLAWAGVPGSALSQAPILERSDLREEIRERFEERFAQDPYMRWLAELRRHEQTDWEHLDQLEDPEWAEQLRRVFRLLARNDTYLEHRRLASQGPHRHRDLIDRFRVQVDAASSVHEGTTLGAQVNVFLNEFERDGARWGVSQQDLEAILAHQHAFRSEGRAEIQTRVNQLSNAACERRRVLGFDGLAAGGKVANGC